MTRTKSSHPAATTQRRLTATPERPDTITAHQWARMPWHARQRAARQAHDATRHTPHTPPELDLTDEQIIRGRVRLWIATLDAYAANDGFPPGTLR